MGEIRSMFPINPLPLLHHHLLIPLLIRGPASTLPLTTPDQGADGTLARLSTTPSPSTDLRVLQVHTVHLLVLVQVQHTEVLLGRMVDLGLLMGLKDHLGRMEDQEGRMGRTGTLGEREEGEEIRTIRQTVPWTMALPAGVLVLHQDLDLGQDQGQGTEGRGQITMSPLPLTTTTTPTRPSPPTASSSAESLLVSLRNRSDSFLFFPFFLQCSVSDHPLCSFLCLFVVMNVVDECGGW